MLVALHQHGWGESCRASSWAEKIQPAGGIITLMALHSSKLCQRAGIQ